MKYRSEIDGLRGIAVLLVILYHSHYSLLSGGFIGVDVFFVISGYVITKSLFKDFKENNFSIKNFYTKRVKRIIPNFIFFSIFTLALGWMFLKEYELIQLSETVFYSSLFLSNLFFIKEGLSYYGNDLKSNLAVHTWSLGVEEQFYIIYPFFIMFIFFKSFFYKKQIYFTLISLSFLLSIICTNLINIELYNLISFYSLPTRAWEFGVGGILALNQKDQTLIKSRFSNIIYFLGILLILIPAVVFDDMTQFPGFNALYPVFGTGILILLGNDKTLYLNKILQNKFLVKLGLISYSLYLYHNPIFIIFDKLFINDSFFIFVISLITSLLVSSISYIFIEKKFRYGSDKNLKLTFLALALSTISILFFSTIPKEEFNNYENKLAISSSLGETINFVNVDERKFNILRIQNSSNKPDILVFGSSRMRQFDSDLLVDYEVLNLSLSGATIDDFYALVPEAVSSLNPKKIYIGLDPWIINENSSDNRWLSVVEFKTYWKKIVLGESSQEIKPTLSTMSNNYEKFYYRINKSNLIQDSSNTTKLTAQGKIIYSNDVINRNIDEIRKNYLTDLNYKMDNFNLSQTKLNELNMLIQYLKNLDIEIYLVLPPYSTDLIEIYENKLKGHFEAEAIFKNFAIENNLKILGSYNFKNCGVEEFFDGFHPSATCIGKVLLSK